MQLHSQQEEVAVAINTGRVVVGGLAAGAVMNAIDFVVQGFVLQGTFEAEMNALNPSLMQGMMSGSATASFVLLDFALGLILVYLYAAIRPRFGPGAGTAFRAAVLLWLASSVTWAFTSAMGVFSWGFFAISSLIALVNTSASAYVGAMLYKED